MACGADEGMAEFAEEQEASLQASPPKCSPPPPLLQNKCPPAPPLPQNLEPKPHTLNPMLEESLQASLPKHSHVRAKSLPLPFSPSFLCGQSLSFSNSCGQRLSFSNSCGQSLSFSLYLFFLFLASDLARTPQSPKKSVLTAVSLKSFRPQIRQLIPDCFFLNKPVNLFFTNPCYIFLLTGLRVN